MSDSPDTLTATTDAARQLLGETVDRLRATAQTGAPAQDHRFFPNGVELISITVRVRDVEVACTIAGEDGAASTLVGWEDEEDPLEDQEYVEIIDDVI